MLLTFTSLATILKLIGVPSRYTLTSIAPVLLVDLMIDLGHTSSGRSAITHSIITAPIAGWLAYILTSASISLLLEPLMLDGGLLETFTPYGCLYASLLHLLLDSLTYQGVHIPGLGWVSMADLESQGAVANIIPVAISIALIYFFWAGGWVWTPI